MEPAERDASVAIRAAVVGDGDALGAIAGRSWEATYRGIVPDPVLEEWIAGAAASWTQALVAVAPDSASRAWVATRNGHPIGYATTSPARDRWALPPSGAGELTNLYLDPDAIGTGVGRALYRHAIRDLGDRGFEPFVVWAFRDNARARAFYERMGLVVDVDDATWDLGGVACPIVRFIGSPRP
jgi:ribosomal protein S18 acetylase RimI-like enzyme